jgi:hypothetical protein
VKYNCSLEQILPPPPPIIIQICNIYIASAQKLVIGRVNEITVKFITIACQNDLTLTFNLKVKLNCYFFSSLFFFVI